MAICDNYCEENCPNCGTLVGNGDDNFNWQAYAQKMVQHAPKVTAADVRRLNEKRGLRGEDVLRNILEERDER